ncbi:autotransporter outer membrane beta-barrel domain-containing protein [Archangium violaceum]|uniref:autotransporter outer membrane beta-barrel domain-containing protein n=1 Tax=Archangium violaceum TaxID=83451 RepID=UPI00193B1CFF|nr:autotransporter outer membrane beta-barrel domain-containing protein [Archangium violaceum]QRK06439.1 autotransporter outer membrane beta-barrel domain-containing protein [Archangium violaceum]
MPLIRLALALSLGSVAPDAPASQPEAVVASPPPSAPTEPGAPSVRPHTRWGLMLDGGLPDLAGASVLYRPLPWLRFSGGLATNTAGVAVRAGVGVAFYFPITPSLNVDVGHYFGADYRPLYQRLGGSSSDEGAELLKDLSYDFASATVGLELGSPRHFVFFVRAGISYWSFDAGNSEAFLRTVFEDPGISADPVGLRFTSPSAKLGFLIYFR